MSKIVDQLLKENDIKGILAQRSKEIEFRLQDIEGSIDDIRESLNEIEGGPLEARDLDKPLDAIVGAYKYFFQAMHMLNDLERKVEKATNYEDDHSAPDWPGRYK